MNLYQISNKFFKVEYKSWIYLKIWEIIEIFIALCLFLISQISESHLNWFFEIFKWKVLASHCERISLKESTKQVLKAHITSLITPAKIGEYGAKALFFKASYRKKILFLNVIGIVKNRIGGQTKDIVSMKILLFLFW